MIFSNRNIPSLVVMSVSTTGVNIVLKHLDCQGGWRYFFHENVGTRQGAYLLFYAVD